MRFVHGGATLQEVVIPVISINKKRQSDVGRVGVELIGGGGKTITTGQLAVVLYQTEPVTEKRQPRPLRVGLYTLAGQLISDSHELTFDMASDNPRERELAVRFILSRKADAEQRAGRVASRGAGDGTSHYTLYQATRYTIRRSFTERIRFLTMPQLQPGTTLMSPLDDKINQHFAGLVVRKDLVKTVKGNAIVPDLRSGIPSGPALAANDEATIETGIDTVREILRKHYVHRNEAGLVRSTIREKGRHKVIDRISVALNDKSDAYEAEFANLGIKG